MECSVFGQYSIYSTLCTNIYLYNTLTSILFPTSKMSKIEDYNQFIQNKFEIVSGHYVWPLHKPKSATKT